MRLNVGQFKASETVPLQESLRSEVMLSYREQQPFNKQRSWMQLKLQFCKKTFYIFVKTVTISTAVGYNLTFNPSASLFAACITPLSPSHQSHKKGPVAFRNFIPSRARSARREYRQDRGPFSHRLISNTSLQRFAAQVRAPQVSEATSPLCPLKSYSPMFVASPSPSVCILIPLCISTDKLQRKVYRHTFQKQAAVVKALDDKSLDQNLKPPPG